MKKITLLLVVLLVFGAFNVAAQEIVPTVTASATLTAGFDLDTSYFGFKNESSATLDVAIFSDSPSAGEVGRISATFLFSAEETDTISVEAGSVAASLFFDPITVQIFGAPSFGIGNATAGFGYEGADPKNEVVIGISNNNGTSTTTTTNELLIVEDADVDTTTDTVVVDDIDGTTYNVVDRATDTTETTDSAFGGVIVTVPAGPINVSLHLASDGDWTNSENEFAFGLTGAGSLAGFNTNFGVVYGTTDATDGGDLGATFGVDGAVGPATIDLGVDFIDGGDLDVSFGLDAAVAPVTFGADVYFSSVGGTADLDAQVALTVAAGPLTSANTFATVDVLTGAALDWDFASNNTIDLGNGIAPYANFGIDDASVIDLSVGANLTGFVDNTVFTVDYTSTDLGTDLGLISFVTTITLP